MSTNYLHIYIDVEVDEKCRHFDNDKQQQNQQKSSE